MKVHKTFKTEQNTVSSTEIYANGEGSSVKVNRLKRSPSKKFEINGELKEFTEIL